MARRRKRASRSIRIDAWDLDADGGNVEHLEANGVTVEILDQVAEEQPRFRANKKHRAATHQMIGPDRGGRMWVICIREKEPFIWRPITGWEADQAEIDWWRKSQ